MERTLTFVKWMLLFSIAFYQLSYAETIVNNNNNNNNGTDGYNNCMRGAATTDPRVPPAGVYYDRDPRGTSTTYTTGETKPYYVDNYCNQTPVSAYPNVWVGGGGRRPHK